MTATTFECGTCGRALMNAAAKTKHEQTCIGTSECRVCGVHVKGKPFRLLRHEARCGRPPEEPMSHTPTDCVFCGDSFASRDACDRHETWCGNNPDVRDYNCDHCRSTVRTTGKQFERHVRYCAQLPLQKPITPRPDWDQHPDKACRPPKNLTPEQRRQHLNIWFPDTHDGSAAYARSICHRCPVEADCLSANIDQPVGIWGGTTPEMRRLLRSRVRRAA